jgi:hypothetical protein
MRRARIVDRPSRTQQDLRQNLRPDPHRQRHAISDVALAMAKHRRVQRDHQDLVAVAGDLT